MQALFRKHVAVYWPVYFLTFYLISPVLIFDLTDKVGIFTLSASMAGIVLLYCLCTSFFRLHLLLFPLYLVVSVDLFMVFFFNSRLTSSYIEILIGQGAHSGEFIGVWWRELAIAILMFSFSYIFLLFKVRNLYWTPPRKTAFMAGGAVAAVYLSVCLVQLARQEIALTQIFRVFQHDVVSHDKSVPFGYASQIYTAYLNRSINKESQKLRRSFNFPHLLIEIRIQGNYIF